MTIARNFIVTCKNHEEVVRTMERASEIAGWWPEPLRLNRADRTITFGDSLFLFSCQEKDYIGRMNWDIMGAHEFLTYVDGWNDMMQIMFEGGKNDKS